MKINRILPVVARWLLGLPLVVFGLNLFFEFYPAAGGAAAGKGDCVCRGAGDERLHDADDRTHAARRGRVVAAEPLRAAGAAVVCAVHREQRCVSRFPGAVRPCDGVRISGRAPLSGVGLSGGVASAVWENGGITLICQQGGNAAGCRVYFN